jgi:hypothetical protein
MTRPASHRQVTITRCCGTCALAVSLRGRWKDRRLCLAGDDAILRREGPPGPGEPQSVAVLIGPRGVAQDVPIESLGTDEFGALWIGRGISWDEVCDEWTPIPPPPA